MNIKESHTKFYDAYVEEQLKKGINHRHISIQELLIKKGLKRNDVVLEIGAGIGTVTGLIAKYIKQGKIVANDISPKSIEVAKQRLSKLNNIEYLVGDIINLEVNDIFDVIVLPDVLEHIPKEEHVQLFEKFHKILNKDGWIFIHIPNPFYLEHITQHQPQNLQELDQPLHLSHLSKVFDETKFYIQELNNYSIYVKENDYQYIVLRRKIDKNKFTSITLPKESLISRVKAKITGIR